jgi:hypothetical protein
MVLPWLLEYAKWGTLLADLEAWSKEYDERTKAKRASDFYLARTYGERFAYLEGKKKPHELTRLLPHEPDKLGAILNDPKVDVESRAKVLEVVLLRGGSYIPMPVGDDAEYDFFEWQDILQRNMEMGDYEDWERGMVYQRMAVDAVLKDPALFDRICLPDARDEFLSSTKRYPATQVMHIMLQPGGWMDGYGGDADRASRHDAVKEWLRALPAETRGKAVWHFGDAVGYSDIGSSSGGRVTGFEVSIGNKAAEFGIGLQWEPSKVADTHWRTTGHQLITPLLLDLDDQERPEKERQREKLEFYAGYLAADPSLELPKDLDTVREQLRESGSR